MAKGTRDYAKSSPNRQGRRGQRKKGLSMRLPMMVVCAVLIFIGGLFYLKLFSHPDSQKTKKVANQPSRTAKRQNKPRFEFYSILPKTPEDTPSARKAEQVNKVETTDKVEEKTYHLQIGAFKSHTDAERLRAELILLGFSAQIEAFTHNGTTLNRVQIGPYSSLAKAEQEQLRLKQKHYNGILRKS